MAVAILRWSVLFLRYVKQKSRIQSVWLCWQVRQGRYDNIFVTNDLSPKDYCVVIRVEQNGDFNFTFQPAPNSDLWYVNSHSSKALKARGLIINQARTDSRLQISISIQLHFYMYE